MHFKKGLIGLSVLLAGLYTPASAGDFVPVSPRQSQTECVKITGDELDIKLMDFKDKEMNRYVRPEDPMGYVLLKIFSQAKNDSCYEADADLLNSKFEQRDLFDSVYNKDRNLYRTWFPLKYFGSAKAHVRDNIVFIYLDFKDDVDEAGISFSKHVEMQLKITKHDKGYNCEFIKLNGQAKINPAATLFSGISLDEMFLTGSDERTKSSLYFMIDKLYNSGAINPGVAKN